MNSMSNPGYRDYSATPHPYFVLLMPGYAGQVIFNGEVIAEKQGFATAEEANAWATNRITKRMKKVFA